MDSLLLLVKSLIAGLLVLSFFLYSCLRWARTQKSTTDGKIKTAAPVVPGSWPIIGHKEILGGHVLPHIIFGGMADKHGPAFIVRLGVHRLLVVNSCEVAKECFTINDKIFSNRPSTVAIRLLGYNRAMFGLAPYGSYWREIRKIATLQLLSNNRLEMLKHIQASEIDMSIRHLYELWVNKTTATASLDQGRPNQVLVEMKQWFGNLTLNIITRMVAGKRVAGVTDEGDDALRCQKAIRDFFHLLGLFILPDAIPFLGWLDLQGYKRAMKRTAKELDCFLDVWLQEHKHRILSSDARDEKDFMDIMLSILEDSKLPDHNLGTIIKSTCLNLILGGNDTTAVTLTWCISLLLNNRHAMKKAQEELDIQVGRERIVEESDIENLKYLQAIIKETFRLYPAAPLSAPRISTEDCTIAGFYVPSGTRLITNIWKIQRDPAVWMDPSNFNPERFLTRHTNLDVWGQHFELIPFGSGRRSCPGINLALRVVNLTLARLLQGFEFATPSDAPVDMTEKAGLTNHKATPLEILLTPRLPSNFYGF